MTIHNSKAIIALINKLDAATREAATMLNVDFVDAARPPRDGACARPNRWSRVLDSKTDVYGIPAHPTVEGDAVMARGPSGISSGSRPVINPTAGPRHDNIAMPGPSVGFLTGVL